MPKTPSRRGVRVIQRPDDERGVVIVFLALALTMLLIFAAFMVDLGAWYKQAQDLQRTADAAALAASTYVGGNAAPQPSNVDLPSNCGASEAVVLSTAPQSVYCSALKVVLKNGYDQAYSTPGFMTTTVDEPNHKVEVTLDQTGVASYFSSFFQGPITLNRSSSAVFSAPIPLGSPQNYFGTGNLPGFPGVSVGPDSQTNPPNGPDFWAAIAGACAPAEMGDPIASYYDGSVGTGSVGGVPDYEAYDFTGGPNGTTCGNTAEVTNSQFNGAGYLYDIYVSPTLGSASLYVYNPYFDPCETDVNGNSYTLDIDWNFGAYGTCGSTNTKMKLYYELQAPGSGSWTTPAISPESSKKTATQINTFTKLADLTTPGTWLLNISSVPITSSGGILVPQTSPDTQSFGTHVYSLLAMPNSGGAATLPISAVKDAGYTCSTLTNAQGCPNIYADPNGGGAEAEIISQPGAESATAYLASIPPSAIGHDVQLKFWGPGVLGQFIQILDATGTPLPSFSETASGNNTAAIPSTAISTCQDPTNGNANFIDPDTGNPVACRHRLPPRRPVRLGPGRRRPHRGGVLQPGHLGVRRGFRGEYQQSAAEHPGHLVQRRPDLFPVRRVLRHLRRGRHCRRDVDGLEPDRPHLHGIAQLCVPDQHRGPSRPGGRATRPDRSRHLRRRDGHAHVHGHAGHARLRARRRAAPRPPTTAGSRFGRPSRTLRSTTSSTSTWPSWDSRPTSPRTQRRGGRCRR